MKLRNKLLNIINNKAFKYLIVGMINTVVGTSVMFGFYNFLQLNYWISTAANYITGSIVSYFLNKYWTFQNKEKSYKIILKFITNILVCYLLAYGLAKPMIKLALSGANQRLQENGAMLTGLFTFTVINYFGQRFFAFRIKRDIAESPEYKIGNSQT